MSQRKIPEKLLPYQKNTNHTHITHIKQGNMVDDETFEHICNGFVNWFEPRKDLLIKNILQVYALTNEELGYNALDHDWLKWKEIRAKRGNPKELYHTAEMIEESIKEKIFTVCCHLSQHHVWEDTVVIEKRFAFVGLLIVVALNVSVDESEKRKTKNVSVDYSVSLDIPAHLYTVYEMDE